MHQERERASRCRPSRLPQELNKLSRHPAERHGTEEFAVEGQEGAEGRVAKAHRLLKRGVEYRREIAGGGIDDLQYLGGGGLLLQ